MTAFNHGLTVLIWGLTWIAMKNQLGIVPIELSIAYRFALASAILLVFLGVTHRGKPPALPGDSPRFDLYDGRCEFLISAKRKEIHDERVSESESHEMGLQVSRGVHTEEAQEANVRNAASALGRVVSRIGLTQGIEDCRRSSDGRSRSYMHQHSSEVRGVERGRVPEGEERDSDCAQVWRATEELYR